MKNMFNSGILDDCATPTVSLGLQLDPCLSSYIDLFAETNTLVPPTWLCLCRLRRYRQKYIRFLGIVFDDSDTTGGDMTKWIDPVDSPH